MSVEWFVLRGDRAEGPLTSSELKLLADQRQITPESLVKQGASGQWVAAGTIEGLFVEYHGARPAPSTGSPPPVRYTKSHEAKPGPAHPDTLAEPPTLASAHGSVGLLSSSSPSSAPPSSSSPSGASASVAKSSAEASEDVQSPLWYLRTPDGQQYGPLSKMQLDQWAAEGRIGNDCWLWCAGWPDWQGASTVYSRLGQALSGISGPYSGAVPSGAPAPTDKALGTRSDGGAGGGTTRSGLAVGDAASALGDPRRWIGQTLGGHYQLVEYLGRGPSGEVYKARHLGLERWVAVRLIPLGGDRRLFDQLTQSLRVAARLSHPHLVEIYDMGESGGVVYLAMELMEGGSLADWIRRAGRVPPAVALGIFHQVVSALAVVHAAGLLHRDIQPSNILFTGQGAAKLSDLGLAPLWEARLRAGPGSVSSSAYYMAPEIFRGQPADTRSDLYSLGATFYHALAGYVPAEGISVEELFRRRGESPIRSITTWVPDLPPTIAAMIDRLLLPDPGLRFASAAELLGMLQAAVSPSATFSEKPVSGGLTPQPSGAAPHPPAAIPAGPSATTAPEGESTGLFTKVLSMWRTCSGKVRLLVGLAGLLILLLLVGLFWGLKTWGSSSETPQEPSSSSAGEAPPDASTESAK